MRRLYLRWVGVTGLCILLAFLGARRYCHEVATLPMKRLIAEAPSGEVRILGQIVAGSVAPSAEGLRFRLTDSSEALPETLPETVSILYTGEETDAIRDLKTGVMIGKWDGATGQLVAHRTTTRPNYGFVTAAYLVGLIPVALFLFGMEYRVEKLYAEIKETKVYEPDGSP